MIAIIHIHILHRYVCIHVCMYIWDPIRLRALWVEESQLGCISSGNNCTKCVSIIKHWYKLHIATSNPYDGYKYFRLHSMAEKHNFTPSQHFWEVLSCVAIITTQWLFIKKYPPLSKFNIIVVLSFRWMWTRKLLAYQESNSFLLIRQLSLQLKKLACLNGQKGFKPESRWWESDIWCNSFNESLILIYQVSLWIAVSFRRDTKRWWSLLSGVYARSTKSHTG